MSGHPGCDMDVYCRTCGDMWCERCSCSCWTCKCPCHNGAPVQHEETEEKEPGVWTVGAEFAVCLPEGWVPTCAEHLPVLIRRAHRLGAVAPVTARILGGECKVKDPHPPLGAGVPVDGADCPRPLTGLCENNTCDHD